MTDRLDQILEKLITIESIAHGILTNQQVGGSQVLVTGLDDISQNLGLVKAGEFRSGLGTPGTDFTGVRMGAPGFTYGTTQYSIVGINNEVLQFGLCHTNGKIYAGAGAVYLDVNGITIRENASGIAYFLKWADASGNIAGQLKSYAGIGGVGHIVEINALLADHSTIGASLQVDADSGEIHIPTGNLLVGPGFIDAVGGFKVDNVAGRIYVPKADTPYVSTAWDGDAKATTDNGTIDLSAVFSVPVGVKAVSVWLQVRDDAAPTFVGLGPLNTYYTAVGITTQVMGQVIETAGVVPCDANGDIYFYCSANVDYVKLQITGYWI